MAGVSDEPRMRGAATHRIAVHVHCVDPGVDVEHERMVAAVDDRTRHLHGAREKIGGLHGLGFYGQHTAEIVNLFRDDERMVQLFRRVKLELLRNAHVRRALQDL